MGLRFANLKVVSFGTFLGCFFEFGDSSVVVSCSCPVYNREENAQIGSFSVPGSVAAGDACVRPVHGVSDAVFDDGRLLDHGAGGDGRGLRSTEQRLIPSCPRRLEHP